MNITEASAAMEWGECWIEPGPVPAELAADVRRITGGFLPGWARRLSSVPWVVRGFARLGEKRLVHMPLELWDLISLVVSQDNSCRYCYGATRAMLKTLGYHDAWIDRLERNAHLTDLSPATRDALQFARKISQANPGPTAADRLALERAGFSRATVTEITIAAALNGFHNRISTAFALPPEAFVRWAQNPLLRVLRPVLALGFRGRQVAPPAPTAQQGLGAAVVSALEGTTFARLIRETIDQALQSPVLPRRTKVLMFAVIARALRCNILDRNDLEALAADGLSSAAVDQILANLGSPALDARETVLLPFARGSVRYHNLALQEQTRALRGQLSRDEIIEAVGVVALANGVARAGVLLDACSY